MANIRDKVIPIREFIRLVLMLRECEVDYYSNCNEITKEALLTAMQRVDKAILPYLDIMANEGSLHTRTRSTKLEELINDEDDKLGR